MPHLLDVISGQATQTFSKKRTALCLFQSCVNKFFQCCSHAQGDGTNRTLFCMADQSEPEMFVRLYEGH